MINVKFFNYLSLALQPEDVLNFFEPVFHQAQELMAAYEGQQEYLKVPFVTVCMCLHNFHDIYIRMILVYISCIGLVFCICS